MYGRVKGTVTRDDLTLSILSRTNKKIMEWKNTFHSTAPSFYNLDINSLPMVHFDNIMIAQDFLDIVSSKCV